MRTVWLSAERGGRTCVSGERRGRRLQDTLCSQSMPRLPQLVHPAARTFAGWRCGWRQEGELLSSDHNLHPVAVVTAASCSSCRIGIGECKGSLVNPLHSSCPSSCRPSSTACAAVVDVGRLGWLCRARSSAFGSISPPAVSEVLDVAAFRFETS